MQCANSRSSRKCVTDMNSFVSEPFVPTELDELRDGPLAAAQGTYRIALLIPLCGSAGIPGADRHLKPAPGETLRETATQCARTSDDGHFRHVHLSTPAAERAGSMSSFPSSSLAALVPGRPPDDDATGPADLNRAIRFSDRCEQAGRPNRRTRRSLRVPATAPYRSVPPERASSSRTRREACRWPAGSRPIRHRPPPGRRDARLRCAPRCGSSRPARTPLMAHSSRGLLSWRWRSGSVPRKRYRTKCP